MSESIVIFKADGDKVSTAIKNFKENYPEFEVDNTVTEIDPDYDASVAFYGRITKPEDVDDIIRLTHHAEGIYEETSFNNVHVEVFAEGDWYGR